MTQVHNNDQFWKQKIVAFLHDPPCKPLTLGNHEEIAKQLIQSVLEIDPESLDKLFQNVKESDHLASGIDRIVFPEKKCSTSFVKESIFIHPFHTSKEEKSKSCYRMKLSINEKDAEGYCQNGIGGWGFDNQNLKDRFFLLWRLLFERVVTQKGAGEMALFPADTRIPDHTIWTHMSLASALEACRVNGQIRPAFLIFQLGPVQDFIAAARNTRDLWSGSYLLSWLVGHAIKAITDVIGPDNIIFPFLRGQGIFDLICQEVFQSVKGNKDENGETLWSRMYDFRHPKKGYNDGYPDKLPICHLLNPSLPNRFLALVPAEKGICGKSGKELAELAEKVVRDEFKRISEKCWDLFQGSVKYVNPDFAQKSSEYWKNMQERWNQQVKSFLQITWVVSPWYYDIDEVLRDFAQLPQKHILEQTRIYKELLKKLPKEDQDERVFDEGGSLRYSECLLWGLNYHIAQFLLDARRNTRDFTPWTINKNQVGVPKDSLTGKEEIIGDEVLWRSFRNYQEESQEGVQYPIPFKGNECNPGYGAISIIKRLWSYPFPIQLGEKEIGWSYLAEKIGVKDQKSYLSQVLKYQSTQELAEKNPPGTKKNEKGEKVPKNPYIAVLMIDGDQMGKWVAGEKLPPLLGQLSLSAKDYWSKHVEKHVQKIFGSQSKNFPQLMRFLTPSYHLQLSEALANFANFVVPKIIDHYDGQLIYAGGDDVLAMLPAEKAVECAIALHAAFQGRSCDLLQEENGCHLHFCGDHGGFVQLGRVYPLLLPGPGMEFSCGIAIAHYQHPLQAMMVTAREAEQQAKGKYNRAALAIRVLKRGGEILEWGSRWEQEFFGVYRQYRDYLDILRKIEENEEAAKQSDYVVSGRFSHALAECLHLYGLENPTQLNHEFEEKLKEIIHREFEHVLSRQGNIQKKEELENFKNNCFKYLENLIPSKWYSEFLNLFLITTFIHRNRKEDL